MWKSEIGLQGQIWPQNHEEIFLGISKIYANQMSKWMKLAIASNPAGFLFRTSLEYAAWALAAKTLDFFHSGQHGHWCAAMFCKEVVWKAETCLNRPMHVRAHTFVFQFTVAVIQWRDGNCNWNDEANASSQWICTAAVCFNILSSKTAIQHEMK